MPHHLRLTAAACAATVSALMLSGCSGGSASGNPAVSPPVRTTSAGSGPIGGAGAGGSPPAGGAGQMRMRVVNLFAPNKAAGPALDIYDVQLTGQQATPLSTNIAYGSASDYFTPHQAAAAAIVQLYALPAGENPVANKADAQNIGAAQDDGSHPQITWVLTADSGGGLNPGPLAGLSFSSRVEKGANNGSKAPVAPPAPSGKGEIMVDTSAVFGIHGGFYLLIDTSCDAPLNGVPDMTGVPYIFAADGQAPASTFALFATTPGSHQVSLVSWTDGTTPTCAQLTAKQGTTTVDVTAGQQIEAYVYGTSDTDVHLALAPIEP